jgi:hypothetical protein
MESFEHIIFRTYSLTSVKFPVVLVSERLLRAPIQVIKICCGMCHRGKDAGDKVSFICGIHLWGRKAFSFSEKDFILRGY